MVEASCSAITTRPSPLMFPSASSPEDTDPTPSYTPRVSLACAATCVPPLNVLAFCADKVAPLSSVSGPVPLILPLPLNTNPLPLTSMDEGSTRPDMVTSVLEAAEVKATASPLLNTAGSPSNIQDESTIFHSPEFQVRTACTGREMAAINIARNTRGRCIFILRTIAHRHLLSSCLTHLLTEAEPRIPG